MSVVSRLPGYPGLLVHGRSVGWFSFLEREDRRASAYSLVELWFYQADYYVPLYIAD